MSWLLITVRRLLWIVLFAVAGGAAFSWWRDHDAVEPTGPAEWPPLPPRPASTPPQSSTPAQPGTSTRSAPPSTSMPTRSSASFVNALVDAPEARSHDGETGGWMRSGDDGACPVTHPIKANDNSGIFHVPEGRFYARTNADRCYQSAEAAVADGYRQAKS